MEERQFYVFLDESGNTGDLVLDKISIRHFNHQPYFVLGGFGLKGDRNQFKEVMQTVVNLKKKHHIYSSELKGAYLWQKKKFGFIYDFLIHLHENEYPIFIELMDKKFFIVASIANALALTTRILGHPLEMYELPIRIFLNHFTDYLYLNLSNDTLIWFSKASRIPSPDRVETFLAFLARDSKNFPEEFKKFVDLALDSYYKMMSEYLFGLKQFTMPPWEYYVSPRDPSSSLKRVSLLPHTTATTNIFARINKYSKDQDYQKVIIIHDEQKQWKEILRNELLILTTPSDISEKLREKEPSYPLSKRVDYNFDRDYKLLFGDSKKTLFLQMADVISSSINKIWEEYRIRYTLRPWSKKIMELLLKFPEIHRSVGVNFVIPKFEYERLVEDITGKKVPWEVLEYGFF